MTIKPTGYCYASAIALGVGIALGIAFGVYLIAAQIYNAQVALLPLVCVSVWLFSRAICSLCRTIELCPEGYWVLLWGIRRLYTWERVRVKCLEDYSGVIHKRRNNRLYPEGAFFTTGKVKRPKWMEPSMFCALTHPYSSFYVAFSSGKKIGIIEKYYLVDEYFIVDKQELLTVLASYGVELDPAK